MSTKNDLYLDELLEYARQLAKEHPRVTTSRKVSIRRQLRKDLRKLNAIHKEYLDKLENKVKLPLAGEWLIENRYLLQEQYQYIKKNFPISYFRRLPALTSGRMKGYRRIYVILHELLRQTEGKSNPEVLVSFLWAYQQAQPLTIGELWAIPLMTRFVIFDQLRKLYEEVNELRLPKKQERLWRKKVLPIIKDRSQELNNTILSVEKYLDLSNPFVLIFLEQQFRRSADLKPLLRWLEARANAQNFSLSKLIEEERNNHARYRAIAGNLFTSLQEINRTNWEEHFEDLSLVEQALRLDPARIYPEMDFDSRNLMRHELELLAKEWRLAEEEVAEKALSLARSPKDPTQRPVKDHVGYYILGEGQQKLSQALGIKKIGLRSFGEVLRKNSNTTYFTSLILLFSLFFTVLLFTIHSLVDLSPVQFIAIGLLLTIPVGEVAVRTLHTLLDRIFPPRRLPKIEFRNGIPIDSSTMVVIPTLLTTKDDLKNLLRKLEVYHLANHDPHIYFALLTDFVDAPEKELPEDGALLEAALKGVATLNEQYPHPEESAYFYLLHRERRYNPQEGVWMGWERKRGKITEFNSLLAGSEETNFSVISGDRDLFKQIRYVITLDADTRLPREAAMRLIGTIAHPLNAPVVDEEKGIVAKGYGILQPKISVSNPSAHRTWFSLLFSDQSGIDIYSGAVSNPYQDLFGRGIFTGKGIYDARIFDRLLRKRFPENTVLSHDLLEGSFLRAGLVTDVELQDDCPSSFLSSLSRKHRWVRGDWQLLPWLKRYSVNQDGVKTPVHLPPITRWQMIDDLRQSLLAPTLQLLIWLGLLILPGQAIHLQPFHWGIIGLLTIAYIGELIKTLRFGTPLLHYLGRQLFNILALPYQAVTMIDAIIRALYRMTFSRRYLLEWVTAAEAGKRAPKTLWEVWRQMWRGQILLLVGFFFFLFRAPFTFSWVGPLFIFWFSAPLWVYLTALPRLSKKERLNFKEEIYLREIARRIWRFFESTVGPRSHWLPPDNLQIDPDNGLAHRTSPTNIGLFLASIVSARDFGYITTGQMIEKIEKTVNTLESLARWHGHFYNWYDTITLEPLLPFYVSTVDSGNLLVYLLVVKRAIKEWLRKPWTRSLAQGMIDTARLEQSQDHSGKDHSAFFEPYVDQDFTLLEWYRLLKAAANERGSTSAPCGTAINLQLEEMEWLFPWLSMLDADPKILDAKGELASLKTLSQVIGFTEEFTCKDKEKLATLTNLFMISKSRSNELLTEGRGLVNRLEEIILTHDFTFLFDRQRRLFSIGYNVSNRQLDSTLYNLLASEARQASFIAIALGQIPVKHWFAMSRTSTLVRRKPVLVSWTGTIFEYLMPLLVMTCHPNSVWEKTYRLVVKSQIAYGKKTKIPWGLSESGYYAFDHHLNYQYKAFGAPDLALKQGLEKEKVVAPYATILSALVSPKQAVANMRRLEKYQAYGEFGFYEALDFTPDRLPEKQEYAVIKSYMAHHQGMSLMALGNLLHGNLMSRRFLADPRIEGTDLLLHERIQAPTLIKTREPVTRLLPGLRHLRDEVIEPRSFDSLDTLLPKARFLSNGRYLVMISNSGGGFSQYKDLLLTRWEEDPIKDNYGAFYYIKNMTDEMTWSPAFQPCRVRSTTATMNSDLEKVAFTRTDGNIHTQMEICVSPEVDAEIRQISLTNFGDYPCVLEVTSLLEPVLAPKDSYQAHPAFSRLFIETEAVVEAEALLAHRRTGNPEPSLWMVHAIQVDGKTVGPLEYETDRSRFVGRGRSYRIPAVIHTNQRLSGTTGAILDPVLALRRCVELDPGATVRFSFITGMAPTREEALEMVGRLSSPYQIQQTFDLAWTRSRMELRDLNLTTHQANILQWMASQIFYYNYYQASRNEYLPRNVKNQSALWAHGISGDFPLVLVRLKDQNSLELASQMLRAHEYWKLKGLTTELALLIDSKGSYQQDLYEDLRRLVDTTTDPRYLDQPGGVYLLSSSTMPEDDLVLLETVARITLRSDEGPLLSQLQIRPKSRRALPKPRPVQLPATTAASYIPIEPPEELLFFNGWGGFTPNGTEYVIQLRTKDLLPAPWSNVIANPQFGFTVSESGGGYTWAKNSREYKLTPWSNDPVLDPSGEICYLRDEKTGLLWSLTALPIRDTEPYTVRHGQGYTLFQHHSQGIDQTGLVFTPMNAPVKIIKLTLRNTEDREREIAVTYYLEWALGVTREKSSPFIITDYDRSSGALLARNVYQKDFPGNYAFLGIRTGGPEIARSWTGDRSEFIGRNGSLSLPAALEREALSNTTGALYNPCGAMQVKLYLPPRGERTVNILVGAASSREKAREYMRQYGRRTEVEKAYQAVDKSWSNLLERIQVQTPDQGFDLLLNRWLLYQTVSCRLWARSAFYQSGGAYGFRDQLQDSLALLHCRSGVTRKQILLHASRQYREGDVQHWWHEETGYGIRTRFSDDLLWLPYVACRYSNHTGDQRIWDHETPFLESPPLQENEMERYEQATVSAETGSLYEHCVRAIERSLRFGEHGLPLMGSGDWNDGMSLVGAGGAGESVWLGWFLYHILQEFIPFAKKRNNLERAQKYESIAEKLATALNEQSWDGQWYRRAYNDRGEPLGSMTNLECQIDCIAQAWGVISGAADPEKALHAMRSLDHKLVRREDETLVCLLTPPFDQTDPSPGYIQAYPRGVRENGGQYTHGAIWAIIAWAMMGEGNKAYELFHILNPINHARTYGEVQHYKVEPYVMAADVYSVPPYEGRGGWTWYTGAAGWMYQAGLEWILGIKRRGARLYIKPCIPEDWPGYSLSYRYGRSTYQIKVENPDGKETGGSFLEVDGERIEEVEEGIQLINDGEIHQVLLIL